MSIFKRLKSRNEESEHIDSQTTEAIAQYIRAELVLENPDPLLDDRADSNDDDSALENDFPTDSNPDLASKEDLKPIMAKVPEVCEIDPKITKVTEPENIFGHYDELDILESHWNDAEISNADMHTPKTPDSETSESESSFSETSLAASEPKDAYDMTDDDTLSHEDERSISEDAADPDYTSFMRTKTEGLNLSELRLDIVRITSDIESGETLYRRAQQRIDSLMGFLEQAEVAVSILNKLEPENRLLKTENRTQKSELDTSKYNVTRLENELKDQKKTSAQLAIKVEKLRSELAQVKSDLNEKTIKNEALLATKDTVTIQLERSKTDAEIKLRENHALQQKMADLSAQIEASTDDRLDLKKVAESYQVKLEDLSDKLNSLETQNSELTLSLRNSERQNVEIRDEMVEIQDKVFIYKKHHEQRLLGKDDKISILENKVIELERMVRHKDEILQSAIYDVADLRKTKTRQEIEREKLEKIIANQNYQLTRAEEDIQRAKHNIEDVNKRQKDLAQAAAMKRIRDTPPAPARPEPEAIKEIRLAQETLEASKSYRSPFLDIEIP